MIYKGRARLGVDFFTFGPYTGVVYTHYCTASKQKEEKEEEGRNRNKKDQKRVKFVYVQVQVNQS